MRAIPLPAVARRSGLTAVHSPHHRARAIVEACLDTISGRLTASGIPRSDAARYVAALFGALSAGLLDGGSIDFAGFADEYATRGGINEQLLATLRRGGAFQVVGEALDDVGRRLEG